MLMLMSGEDRIGQNKEGTDSMIKVGLTGGICSGKSTISSMIKRGGNPSYRCRYYCKRSIRKNTQIYF